MLRNPPFTSKSPAHRKAYITGHSHLVLFQLEMLHIMRSVTPVSPTASLHIVFFVLLDLCDVTGKDQSRLEQNRKKLYYPHQWEIVFGSPN